MIWWSAYFLVGLAVGFLAGLLGIGGGMTLVPIFAATFAIQALSAEHNVHLALGTAMASVVFTGTASVRSHHRLGTVEWPIVRRVAPALVVGVLLSSLVSGLLPQRVLALGFAVITYLGATQILLGAKPAARGMPKPLALTAVSIAIGVICGLVAAGGAFLTVPLLLYGGLAVHRAIGTAAAIGVPVAIVGAIGYIASGWRVPSLPDPHIGFVYIPALLAVVAGSWLTAPVGARVAHRLPVLTLRRVFAGLLYLLATKMAVTYW